MTALDAAPFDPFAALAQAAELADPDERMQAAAGVLRKALAFGSCDELTWDRLKAYVKRHRLMSMKTCEAIAKEARQLSAEVSDALAGASLPEGALAVDGMPAIAYLPGDGSRGGDAGEVLERARGDGWRRLLSWAPAVLRVLEAPNDEGETTARFYEVRAGGRSVLTSHDELLMGKPWETLPVAGTASRRTREVLAQVVLAEAQACQTSPAISRTGWHVGDDGKPFYVFADGRAHDGREVLIASAYRDGLVSAARPVPAVPLEQIRARLLDIREHGRGPALAAIGLATRGFGHSFHAVPGGAAFVGPKFSGKTNAAWHGRTMTFVRQHKASAYPPLPSAPFPATPANIEAVLDFEADTLGLLEDIPLHPGSSRAVRADAEAKLEQIFRSLFNETAVRPRATITMAPRPRRYVRSPVVVTAQELHVQPSLLNRFLLLRVKPGDVDVDWYKGPDRTSGNSAALVPALRTLAEAHIIPVLAQFGERAGEYLAARDAAAMELLAPALEARVPGWESSETGIARVADIAAAALGGLLIVAELVGMDAAELAALATEYLADALAAQAHELGDMDSAESHTEAAADAVRAAWLAGRAHVCDAEGVPYPALDGLGESEQGLELVPGAHEGAPRYRGRGVPFYWLPELGALGVKSESMHALLRAADAALVRGRPAKALPALLLAEGIAMPSGQQGAGSRQVKIGARNVRLVLMRPEIFFSPDNIQEDAAEPVTPATPATAQVSGTESNGDGAEALNSPATAQVSGTFGTLAEGAERFSDSGAGLGGSSSNRSETPNLLPAGPANGRTLAERAAGGPVPPGAGPRCRVCEGLIDPVLAGLGMGTHPACDPGPVLSAAELAARGFPPELAEPAVPPAPAPAASPSRPSPPPRSPRRAQAAARASASPSSPLFPFLVLGGDGRAYGPDGEVREVPPGALEAIANRGELAALGLALGVGRPRGRGVLYVPRAAREAMRAARLPAEVPEQAPGEGMPHGFTEATDTTAWDISPAGLAAWVNVFRLPASLHEGIDLAFPEWMRPVRGDGPQLGELAPAELAAALTLISRAPALADGARGSVHFHRSAPATMRRALEASVRRSRHDRPEPPALPLPFTPEGRKAGASVRRPGDHVAPVAEVPPGWVLGHLDVNSCYLSAPIGTEFAIGEYQRLKPGRADGAPGVHLVRAPAAAAAIHPGLTPWFPRPARRQAEVSAWLDTLAVRWLSEQGVPLQVLESWVAQGWRVFDGPLQRLGDARAALKAAPGRPERAAAGIVSEMYQRTLGGWLASEAWDRSGDWLARPDWWLTVGTQAEVRKQRNLLPALQADAGLVILAHSAIDTAYVAAPSLAALKALPGAGGRPLIREGRGGFALEAHAEVTPELSAILARGDRKTRLAAIREHLAQAGEAEQDRK